MQLELKHKDIVVQILKKNLPEHALVWVFGSRANRNPKKFSDLDLAIDCGRSLSNHVMIDLKEDFDASDLPYKVDLVDWYGVDVVFQKIIDKDRAYKIDF